MTKKSSTGARKRGRPRSAEAEQAILKSAFAVLSEKGVSGLTVEGVAARAGVGKPTIYRYWANAQELALAAILAQPLPDTLPKASPAPLEDLRRQLTRVAEVFASPQGRSATMMLAASENDSELSKAFRNQIILRCRTEGREILQRAMDAGEIGGDTDLDIALDLVYGPLFYRLLSRHGALDAKFANASLALLLAGLQRPADPVC